MLTLLSTLESARRKRNKEKEVAGNFTAQGTLTEEDITKAWDEVGRQAATGNPKVIRRWHSLQLDDFEADMARYVLMALYHYARELTVQDHSISERFTHSSSFAAAWKDFAGLQSGEAHQVTRFPELLDNHIRIFQVLVARFGVHGKPQSQVMEQLADVVTTTNVRVALGVDPGNSFGIWEVPMMEESEELGLGIYPIPSFFNHRT